MALKYLRELKHKGTVEEIARLRFPYPNEEHPDLETVLNEPEHRIAVGQADGQDLFPDIVVVKMPGQWLRMIAEVETKETVTDEEAEREWKPFSEAAEHFYLYVPMGMASEAKRICKRHGVKLAGVRTWRYRPVWGLEVIEA